LVDLARCSIVLAWLVVAAAPARAASADITIHTGGLQLGSVSLRDVTVSLHTVEHGARTCVSAALGSARIRGCGLLEERGGQLLVRHGRVTLAVPHQSAAGMSLAATTVTSTLDGNLSNLDLVLNGSARSDELALHATLAGATLQDITLPFSVRVWRENGALRITESSPLRVRVAKSSLAVADARIRIAPVITLHCGWPRWRLDLAWSDVELAPVLAAASGGRVSGTGSLAGELAFHGDGSDVRLARGFALVPRSGQLRITDAALRARLVASVEDRLGIQQRLATALTDFTYSSLAVTFGADRIQISVSGRGKRVPQEIDLTVNLRKSP
jgi:hypothetical protein